MVGQSLGLNQGVPLPQLGVDSHHTQSPSATENWPDFLTSFYPCNTSEHKDSLCGIIADVGEGLQGRYLEPNNMISTGQKKQSILWDKPWLP